jgi:hypothetical protein
MEGGDHYNYHWEWTKLYKEKLNVLNSPPSNVCVFKSRRMRLASHLAGMVVGEMSTGFWCVNLRERDNMEYTGVDGKIILRRIFTNCYVGL